MLVPMETADVRVSVTIAESAAYAEGFVLAHAQRFVLTEIPRPAKQNAGSRNDNCLKDSSELHRTERPGRGLVPGH